MLVDVKRVKLLIGLSLLGMFGVTGSYLSAAEESQTKDSVGIEETERMSSLDSSEVLITETTSESQEVTTETTDTEKGVIPNIQALRSSAPAQEKKAPEGNYISDGSYVQIASKNYDIWSSFQWEKRSHSSNYYGLTLKAKGRYEHANGATYYSLYNRDNKWIGYINAKATKRVPAEGNYISDGSYVKLTNFNYNTWQSFNWQKKYSGSNLKGKIFKAKGRYEHFNGSTYYSLYDNTGKWYGYLSAAAVTKTKAEGDYISDGSYVNITKKNYDIWQNFGWKKKSSTNSYYGKTLRAKGRYEHHNGSIYYSLYDNKNRWLGYLNANATTKTRAEGNYIKDGRYVEVTKNNYSLWQNFKFEFRGNSDNLQGQILQARGRYEHFNGATYYSLYDDLGFWRGYINATAVKKAYKPRVELSEKEIKLAQEEMLKLVNKERRRVKVNELKRDPYFDRAANYRAREIRKQENFVHRRPDGTDILDVVEEAGADISNLGAGENIAYNQLPKNDGKAVAKLLFNQWMDSPGHKRNIQYGIYDYVGFGFYAERLKDNSVRVYGAQIFIVVY